MNSFKLATAYIKHKFSSALLTVITFAIGVAIILSLVSTSRQMEGEFSKNLQGIDLVVSGKGSPLQIILSTVFQLDIPTGNIPIEQAEQLSKHPMVASAIPMALGDNYNGHRIVGTDESYIKHYNGELKEGRFFTAPMEAVLGSEVAASSNLKPGAHIVGAHGLVNSDDLHSDSPYLVVGILQPTHSVLDRLVLTPVESVWHVHEHPDADNPEEIAYKKDHPGKELTALLITYKSPFGAAILPRMINKNFAMQAASPAAETARLLALMGNGTEAVKAFGILIICLGALSMFVNLYNSMNERKYDMALMRTMGASRLKLLKITLCESLALSLSGAVLGVLLSLALNKFASAWIYTKKHVEISSALPQEAVAYVFLGSILLALLAGVIPAIKVYRIDIFKTLVRK